MDPPRRAGTLPFFLLTFALSWAIFVPVALRSGSRITPLEVALITLGAWMPAVAALLLARREGTTAPLLARLTAIRAGAAAWAFALAFPIALKLATALVHRALLGAWPPIELAQLPLVPFAILFSAPFQAGEELGWRAYALPRLAARIGLRGGSLVLGLLWALWHLPLFFVRGADSYGQSFPLYTLQVIGLSAVFAALFARTGALPPVMLLHATFNNVKGAVPAALAGGHDTFGWSATPVFRIGVALILAAGLVALAFMPRRIADPPAP